MRAAWSAWKRALSFIGENAVRLIVLNLLWAAVAWLILPLGPATLALYWFIAVRVRDERDELRYTDLLKAMGRFFVRGLVWFVGWAAVIFLAYAGGVVWGQFLPPLAATVIRFAWVYALIYLAAMQPYLLEALTVDEESWGAALKRSAWQVMANPVYSHAHLLVPAAAVFIAAKTNTVASLVLVSLTMLFFAVAAADTPWKHGAPPPMDRRIEDVL